MTLVKSTEQTDCQAFSPVVRIGTPSPSHASECAPPPPLVQGGAFACVREVGGPDSDEETATVVLQVCMYLEVKTLHNNLYTEFPIRILIHLYSENSLHERSQQIPLGCPMFKIHQKHYALALLTAELSVTHSSLDLRRLAAGAAADIDPATGDPFCPL